MENKLIQKHSLNAWLYLGSRLFEKASFYGLRAIIVLYLTDEVMNMSRGEALNIYGIFTGFIFLSEILGAILGDLLWGNKKALIIGGIVQALGAFSMCIPSTSGVYIGLGFVVLGGGLYSPNLTASLGKLYLSKKDLLGSVFTLFYIVFQLGVFLGILVIGYIGEIVSWDSGFILAGILMIFAVLLALIKPETEDSKTEKSTPAPIKGTGNIWIAFGLVSLFWAFHEFAEFRPKIVLGLFIENPDITLSPYFKDILNMGVPILLALIAAFIFVIYQANSFVKLAYGFLLGAASFGILLAFPETPSEQHFYFYVLAAGLLSLSEILISPIIYSVIVRYGNPKYLAILISLSYLPTLLIKLPFFLIDDMKYYNPVLAVSITAGGMLLMGLGIFLGVARNKELSLGFEKIE